MGKAFDYVGEVGINDYGVVLREPAASYLQQELARHLGLDWSHAGHWHGVMRIRIELEQDEQDR